MYGRKFQEIEKSSCKVPCPLKPSPQIEFFRERKFLKNEFFQ